MRNSPPSWGLKFAAALNADRVSKTSFVAALGLVLTLFAAPAEGPEVPTVTSIFPLGGRRGSHFDAIFRGENLEGAYAVWFDCPAIKASIKSVRDLKSVTEDDQDGSSPVKSESKKPDKKLYEVAIKIEVDRSAALGAHAVRLATPKGASGALWFLVDSEPSVLETDRPHATFPEAQAVDIPVVVNGTLARADLDSYSFEAAAGQELQIEVRTTNLPDQTVSADPQLVLYQPSGSWFDPNRGMQLEVTDLWRPPPGEMTQTTAHRLPRVRHVFQEAGRYIAGVSTVDGLGGPDYSYQLRIVPVERSQSKERERWGPLVSAHMPGPVLWKRRNFITEITSDRLDNLEARTVSTSTPKSMVTRVAEHEPNDNQAQALDVPVPAIIDGTIGQPRDVDWFSFQVKAGERLAFEIESPYVPVPFFNPRLTIFNQDGQELANNIYRSLGGDGDDWIKTPMPKTMYTFDKAGTYRFQIRDLTSRAGGADFAYRIMVRPQVPHVGEVVAKGVDRIHLVAGESRSITLAVELEEGFDGEVAVSVEDLPPGVSAVTGLSASDKGNTPSVKVGDQIHMERHLPQPRSVTIMFMTDIGAPPTGTPHPVRVVARPVLKGKPGRALPCQEILLTVSGREKQAALGVAKAEKTR
jgi:hypothetical protein